MLHRAECLGGESTGAFVGDRRAGLFSVDVDDGIDGGHQHRLLAAVRTVCHVLDVPALKREEAAAGLRCFCAEAQAWRSWAERAADWGRCGTPDDPLLHYHSDADVDGVTATQEIEFAQPAEAEGAPADAENCSVCLDEVDQDNDNENVDVDAAADADDAERRCNCYIWFLYTRTRSPYKAGLIYSPDSGSWTQFVTARDHPGSEVERLVATHSDAFSPACPHLIGSLRGLLINLKYLVLRLYR